MLCQNESCQKKFVPKVSHQKFCSSSCTNVAHVRRWRKKNSKRCLCGKSILPESIQCSSCVAQARSWVSRNTTLSEYHNKSSLMNKHPSWKNAHIRSLARSWNRDIINLPCQHCGYSKHVELAHIKPISTFLKTATIGEINDPSNILVLCRNCHWEFDNKILLIDQISAR